jgi:hypothetical protein
LEQNLAIQTKNAFDFIQKLYMETSYLIKEMEGHFQQEDERFIILRPSGYGITTRSSTGLEALNVEQWLTKNLSVFFLPEDLTELKGGQTITPVTEELKVLFLHIRFIDKTIEEPTVYFGVIEDIKFKKDIKKFENMVWEFSYNNAKIFSKPGVINYEDSSFSFKGLYKTIHLYSLSDSEALKQGIVVPMVDMYRERVN